jgi:ABC-type multidrug transport system fused ATPase/permease subunit
MSDDLSLDYRRWRSSEDADDDAADAAFAAVYEAAVSQPLPSREFVARTMAAVSAASEAQRRRSRLFRRALVWVGVPAAAVLLYLSAGTLISLASSALVQGLNLVVSTVVLFVSGSEARRPLWSLVTGLGRATAAFVSDPRVTVAMLAFQGVAVVALVALHRLLGSEREWLR